MAMKERLRKLINYQGLSIRDFEKKNNITEGIINKYLLGKSTPTIRIFMKIAECNPQLNIDWLITGRGSMFYNLNENDAILQASDSQIVKILLDRNEALIRENDRLQDQVKELQKKISHCECASTSMETSIS